MRLLEDGLIKDHYDVVVVGAGIGGLTAAALLAKKGIKLLVIDQHYIPGGCCTCIRRNDITFDVGAAVFFGCGEGGMTPHRYVMNSLEQKIDLIQHQAIYRIHMNGKTVTFWRDMDRFLDELIDMFPHQREQIKALYKEMEDFYVKRIMTQEMVIPVTEIPWKEQLKSIYKDPVSMVLVVLQLFKSAEDLLKKHISDPDLIAFYDYLMSFFTCCNVDEAPAIIATSMFIDSHKNGACYAQGSPQMLPNKLEKTIEENGGQMLYRHLVDEVLIENGRAYGVRLSDGREIMATNVIANATVWNLYGKLVKPRHINPKRMEWAQKFEPTTDLFLLYLGVKAEAIPEDAQPVELLIDNIHDFQGDNFGIFIPSLEDPTLAPPGMHSMTVMAASRTETEPNRFGPYQSEEYYRRKQEEAEIVIDKLEKMYFTNLKKNIISIEAATPASLERFTLKNWGNIGGPKLSMKQFFMRRPKAQSDWKNLFLCGDSTSMGEGVISTTSSGVGAANMVLRSMGLPEYLPKSFTKQYINYVEGKAWTPPPESGPSMTAEDAVRLSKECQLCEKPACKQSCPAGIDVLNFVRRIEAGNVVGAARSMREMNPLAEICGHVCPAERLCQKECNRLDFSDRTVKIADLQAWACREAGKEGWDHSAPPSIGRRVAVVGAGPAGLACAYYLGRLGYGVDVYDKAKGPGGMLTHAIPSFRLPAEVVERELSGISKSGLSFKYGQKLGKDFTVKGLMEEYNSVFLAPGLWAGRSLNIKGMKKSSVTDALDFLMKNRSPKKGKKSVGQRVLVIGGGSVAADAAITAQSLGAKTVTMVCLEGPKEMPCLQDEVVEMKKKGINILNSWGPQAVISEARIAFIKCTRVFDDQGCFSPAFDDSKSKELDFDQIIMAVGQTLEPALAKYFKKELKVEGLLEVEEETLQVKGAPGLYAGGDIIRGAGTVVEAAADGRRAAQAIDFALRGH